MGLKCTEMFADANTDISLEEAYVSLSKSQVVIMPGQSGSYTISSNGGVWKSRESRDAGKAPLCWKDIAVVSTANDIQQTGVYKLLYDALRAQLPAAVDT